ncbi:MAG: zinc-ribbon domain-containing protein [Coriobacteriales bacterium]|nr:zinc-ribbon domain-containing protein [Coriobacteriales bacterium]
MFCPNCGAQLPDGSKFCLNCGFKMPGAAGMGQQPTAQQAPVQQPAYQQPTQPFAPYQQVPPPQTPKGKGSKGLIIALTVAAAVLLLAGGLVLAIAKPWAKTPKPEPTPTVNVTTPNTPDSNVTVMPYNGTTPNPSGSPSVEPQTTTVYLPTKVVFEDKGSYGYTYTETVERDASGRVTRYDMKNNGFDGAFYKEYTYMSNEPGDMRVKTYLNVMEYDGNSTKVLREYSYDAQGRTSQVVTTRNYQSSDEWKSTGTYTYDAQGNLTKIKTVFEGDGWTDEAIYTYDSAGNLLTAGGADYVANKYQYNGKNQLTYFEVYTGNGGAKDGVSIVYGSDGYANGSNGECFFEDGSNKEVEYTFSTTYQIIDGFWPYAEFSCKNGYYSDGSANVAFDSNNNVTHMQINKYGKNGNDVCVWDISYQAYTVPVTVADSKALKYFVVEPSYTIELFTVSIWEPGYQPIGDLVAAADTYIGVANDFAG